MGGGPGMWCWFYNGGDGKFLKSLYIVGTGGANSLILWRPSLYCLYSLFQVLPTPPTSLSPQTLIPNALSVVMFLWLNGWSCHIWCAILCNNNMDLHMSSLGTLVTEGPWYVFYAKGVKLTEVWHIMWLFTGTLIWYHTHTHTNKHSSTLQDQ